MAESAAAESLWSPRRLVIGIGELAVSNRPGDVIVTHALGSCIAVCVFDPVASIAGMLHFLLPEARINPERARQQPAVFADTGIPLLFQTAYEYGLVKRRPARGSTPAAATRSRQRIFSGATACSCRARRSAAPAPGRCICRSRTAGCRS
jgi:hypothetical protein